MNPLRSVQWKLTDLFFRGRGASGDITIIAIDEKSLATEAKLGRFKDWPRGYYAQLLHVIDQQKPAVVAFDLDFKDGSNGISSLRLSQLLRDYEFRNSTPSGMGSKVSFDWYRLLRKFEGEQPAVETGTSTEVIEEVTPINGSDFTHPDDKDFQDTINASGPVVLASSLTFGTPANDEDIEGYFPTPKNITQPIFSGDNVTIGYVNVFRDRDGVLRRFTPNVKVKNVDTNSFPLAIVEAYQKETRSTGDINYAPQMLINYAAKPGSYRTLSFVDVVNGRFESTSIQGKIVLIGATAKVIQDLQNTPTSGYSMAGVEVNANMVQQLLEGKNLREQGFFSTTFLCAIFAIIGVMLFLVLSLRFVWVAFFAGLIGFPILAYGSYQAGLVLNIVYPEVAWIFAAVASLWYRNETELRAKREIKKAFSHYVSPVVVNELAKHPEALKLGGRRENISVMFSDIVGFTTLAEKLSPEDTVALLNDYLTAMTEVIFSYHGTLDKYQGDAIMALFGAPLVNQHRAVDACHTALGMRKALVSLHERWNRISELPHKDELIKLDFRVGIATGNAIVGNVGSERRFDYTAIGDIVNLGSRLESVNRKYGTHVIVDKGTFTAVTENHNPFVFRKLDTVRVKGKEHPTDIFEVVALAENITDEIKGMLDDFENGRILYTQRNFLEAKQYFESALTKVQNDGPSQIYRNRCNFFLRKPPSMDWNAVVDLVDK
jgi:adenylate cyclase